MADLRCQHCGANLTPRDMEKPSCPYCETVLPHRARAAEQAEVVRQMLADRDGDGIPDAYAPMVQRWGGPADVAAVTRQATRSAGQTILLGVLMSGCVSVVVLAVMIGAFVLIWHQVAR